MGLNCPIDRKFQSSEVYKETAGRHSEAVGDFAKQTVSQDSLSARFSQAEIRVPVSRRTLLKMLKVTIHPPTPICWPRKLFVLRNITFAVSQLPEVL